MSSAIHHISLMIHHISAAVAPGGSRNREDSERSVSPRFHGVAASFADRDLLFRD